VLEPKEASVPIGVSGRSVIFATYNMSEILIPKVGMDQASTIVVRKTIGIMTTLRLQRKEEKKLTAGSFKYSATWLSLSCCIQKEVQLPEEVAEVHNVL